MFSPGGVRAVLAVGLIAAGVFSCSPHWHIKKACHKDPTLCNLDTIISEINILPEPVVIDSTFVYPIDSTFQIINQDSVIVNIITNKKGVPVYIDCVCPPNRIEIRDIPKYVVVEPAQKWHNKLTWWGWLAVGMAVGLVALVIVKL